MHYCIDNGLMQGVSSTQFLPDGSTTRAQLVTILWRLEGAPAARGDETFLDAADGAWYTAAVRWAAGEGLGHAVRVCNYIYRDAVLGDMFAKLAKAPK